MGALFVTGCLVLGAVGYISLGYFPFFQEQLEKDVRRKAE